MTVLVGIVLWWLMLLAAVISSIVYLSSRSKRERGGALRRFFQYGMLLLLVILAATGLTGLLTGAAAGTGYRAFMLSCVIVGTPGLVLMAGWVRRTLGSEGGDPPGWKVYLTVAEMVGLLVGGAGAVVWGQRLLEGRFDRTAAVTALVWGLVWLVHHTMAGRRALSARHEWGVILGSLVGLTAAAGFGVAFLDAILQRVYDAVWGVAVLAETGDALREGLSGLAVGGAAWVLYWWRLARRGECSTLWRGYVLLAGVVGGLVIGLAGVWNFAYRILDWLAGGSALPAGLHFGGLPLAVALAVIGGGLWRYHRAVLRSAAAAVRTEVDRVYEYTVSGVGLLAAAAGSTAVAAASIGALTPSRFIYPEAYDRSGLIAAVTVLAVGGPLWWRSWSSVQRKRNNDPGAELRSPNRRIYLTCLFGVGGLVALVSLLVLVYEVAASVLDRTFDDGTVFAVRWPLSLVVIVGLTAAYHWAVRRADLAEAPETGPAAAGSMVKSVVLLGSSDREAAGIVRERTGIRVEVWARPDAEAPLSAEEVIEAIESAEHPNLLIVARPEGPEVIPYNE